MFLPTHFTCCWTFLAKHRSKQAPSLGELDAATSGRVNRTPRGVVAAAQVRGLARVRSTSPEQIDPVIDALHNTCNMETGALRMTRCRENTGFICIRRCKAHVHVIVEGRCLSLLFTPEGKKSQLREKGLTSEHHRCHPIKISKYWTNEHILQKV